MLLTLEFRVCLIKESVVGKNINTDHEVGSGLVLLLKELVQLSRTLGNK